MQKNNFFDVNEKYYLKITIMGIALGLIPIHGDQAFQNVDRVRCTTK